MGPHSHNIGIYLYLRITNYSFTIDFPGVHSDGSGDYDSSGDYDDSGDYDGSGDSGNTDEVGKSTKLAQVHVAGGTKLKLKFFYN